MLASTMYFSNNNPVPHTPHTNPQRSQNRVIGAARKPETQVPEKDTPQPVSCSPSPGPVVSGPNSVPNTTQRTRSGCVPGPAPRREPVRTSCRHVPPGTYLLIFPPRAPAPEQ